MIVHKVLWWWHDINYQLSIFLKETQQNAALVEQAAAAAGAMQEQADMLRRLVGTFQLGARTGSTTAPTLALSLRD